MINAILYMCVILTVLKFFFCYYFLENLTGFVSIVTTCCYLVSIKLYFFQNKIAYIFVYILSYVFRNMHISAQYKYISLNPDSLQFILKFWDYKIDRNFESILSYLLIFFLIICYSLSLTYCFLRPILSNVGD